MRLLIVEDSQALAQALDKSLTREGYVCDHALDGEQALAFLQAFDYDLVILDWMLPKRDGISVLGEMRQRGLRCGVLMLSARGQVDDRVTALDAGADDYLVKPFSTDELLARLRALARRPLDAPPRTDAAGRRAEAGPALAPGVLAARRPGTDAQGIRPAGTADAPAAAGVLAWPDFFPTL